MVMRAGGLRHRIVIQEATETQNSFNEAVPVWSTFAERYASLVPQSGREFIAASQIVPELQALITLRWVNGVTPKMRVQMGTRVFDILAVLDLEGRNREMQLACRELVTT
jgi:SPP1 family predicted phage head-tail adaptor